MPSGVTASDFASDFASDPLNTIRTLLLIYLVSYIWSVAYEILPSRIYSVTKIVQYHGVGTVVLIFTILFLLYLILVTVLHRRLSQQVIFGDRIVLCVAETKS